MKILIGFSILFATFFLGCKKDSKPASNDKYVFTGTVDGNPVHWEVRAIDNNTDTSRYQARPHYFYSQWPLDCATTNCYDVAAGSVLAERNQGNAIQVLQLEAAKAVDMNALKLRFSAGVKPYGMQRTSLYTNTTNGILVRYTENGRTWQSEIGDQTGSSFESLEFKAATTDTERYSHVWRARFSCKVYFNGLPSKTLTNCEVYGPAFYR